MVLYAALPSEWAGFYNTSLSKLGHKYDSVFLLKKALNWSCMLGVPEELVQAYITVLLQYKKGLTLGSKGIKYRKNKKTQGKQALDPFSQLHPSS